MPDYLASLPPIATGGLGSLAAGLCTALGALPALVLRSISPRAQDMLLGFAAGVMLAASFFSLILPAMEEAELQGAGTVAAVLIAIGGLWLGAVALWLTNRTLPHEHLILKYREGVATDRLRRIWLFVAAITIHNFPEGLAVGVGYGGGDIDHGNVLAVGIGLQNVPEGLAVAVALLTERYSGRQAFAVAVLTGLVEPVGGLFGAGLVSLSAPLLPWGLAFAGGAMLFVISHEIIPETHRRGFETHATFAMMGGFGVMMLLDVVFG